MAKLFRLLGIRQRAAAYGLVIAAGLGLSLSCHKPDPVPVAPDATVSDACVSSCANQRRLQCEGASGKSSPRGASCEDVCRDQSSTFNLAPVCVAKAEDCTAVYKCFGQ